MGSFLFGLVYKNLIIWRLCAAHQNICRTEITWQQKRCGAQ